MKRQWALVGFGHQVQSLDVLAGSPLVTKTVYRHYRKCHHRGPEILIIETDDSEEVPYVWPGENHDD